MVREVYKQHVCPLARVVHGLQTSWEPAVVILYHEDVVRDLVWSPCSKFIAVAKFSEVEIRDAATFNLLNTLKSPLYSEIQKVSFSLDGCFLAQFNCRGLVSWDLQTGGPVGVISLVNELYLEGWNSSTCSMDGRILAASFYNVPEHWDGYYECFVEDHPDEDDPLHKPGTFIATYDLSGANIQFYPILEGKLIHPIWIHDKSLQFATVSSGDIIIWEVMFNSINGPEVIDVLPALDDISDARGFVFLPTLSRLAALYNEQLFIWDLKVPKVLLNFETEPLGLFNPQVMEFSPYGHFFGCTLQSGEFYIWKESPTGYMLYQKFLFNDVRLGPFLSPNGKLILADCHPAIHLWHTKDQFSSNQNQVHDQTSFILGFFKNEALAAFIRCWKSHLVTILNLQSGDPQLIIDVGMGVLCLRVTESAILVVGEEKFVTWNLSGGGVMVNIDDSVQITNSNGLQLSHKPLPEYLSISISSDLSHIAVWRTDPLSPVLDVYDVFTGGLLASTTTQAPYPKAWQQFTPDGHEIWGGDFQYTPKFRWKIVQNNESQTTGLQDLIVTVCPPGVLPWLSTNGYEVTGDGWVLSPTQKRLLWLPHHWRSEKLYRTWSGRFLGLQHHELPEIVILEFFE